jgi:hypothetical protein
MKNKYFHSDVDYNLLHLREKKYKACTDLFTIFYLSKNIGLTDLDIYNWAIKLKFSGYDGMTPECIVRSNIYRWNSISNSIFGKVCLKCQKYANYGLVQNEPSLCKKHREPNMKLVVEERLYRAERESTSGKGKYFLDPIFLSRILTINDFLGLGVCNKLLPPPQSPTKNDEYYKLVFDSQESDFNEIFNFDTMDIIEPEIIFKDIHSLSIMEFLETVTEIWNK